MYLVTMIGYTPINLYQRPISLSKIFTAATFFFLISGLRMRSTNKRQKYRESNEQERRKFYSIVII
jgi:hypothetical protein